jgi:hypothetical protein
LSVRLRRKQEIKTLRQAKKNVAGSGTAGTVNGVERLAAGKVVGPVPWAWTHRCGYLTNLMGGCQNNSVLAIKH